MKEKDKRSESLNAELRSKQELILKLQLQIKQIEDSSTMSKKNLDGMDKVLKNLKAELDEALQKNKVQKEEISNLTQFIENSKRQKKEDDEFIKELEA